MSADRGASSGATEVREFGELTRDMVLAGTVVPLDPERRPGSFLARSDPRDVARVDTARGGPGSARCVADAPALLESYAGTVAALNAKVPVVLVHRLWSDPIAALINEIALALDRTGTRWAVTGGAASSLLAPYLSTVSIVELYGAPCRNHHVAATRDSSPRQRSSDLSTPTV